VRYRVNPVAFRSRGTDPRKVLPSLSTVPKMAGILWIWKNIYFKVE
jgi:hypothetical protein